MKSALHVKVKKPNHVSSLIVICDRFSIGMVALFYGYEKKIVKQQSHDEVRIGLKVLAIVTILLSLVGALQSLVRQFRSSFRI